ncbi:MAG: DNA-3-methyladenine glycosylase I [Flavobacteriales bacterium]|nr:DNA-3-methyladenine glycosylase I [Flavobacteriales bacterium]
MQNKVRCGWCEKDDLYRSYHDHEWGRVSHNDHHLFEHLILETFQAGLSWYTILSKRENFRKAFRNFDAYKICKYTETEVEKLMMDPGIIRSKPKILAAINNATRFIEIVNEFGTFDAYIWQFTNFKTLDNKYESLQQIPAQTKESNEMSKDLRKRGFKFIGPVSCYAFMQSVGMVNDHIANCWIKKEGIL